MTNFSKLSSKTSYQINKKIVQASATVPVSAHTHVISDVAGLQTALDSKQGSGSYQATLVSATNIKTINGSSILGAGDLTVSGGGGGSSPILSWMI